jgi:GST-like protein
MIELYFFPSPNALKVLIFLEESGLDYTLKPVDIASGEQFAPAFLAISPNNKVPAIRDNIPGEPALDLFESGAILEYLADKCGRFLPPPGIERLLVKQWLYWQVGGLGPMAGQAHHFRAFAPEQVPYGIARYTDEVNRLYGVLDKQLQGLDFVTGDYSIADMAIWPWIAPHERQGQDLKEFPNIGRWFARVGQRPAVQRADELGRERLLSPEEYGILLNQTSKTAKNFNRD